MATVTIVMYLLCCCVLYTQKEYLFTHDSLILCGAILLQKYSLPKEKDFVNNNFFCFYEGGKWLSV